MLTTNARWLVLRYDSFGFGLGEVHPLKEIKGTTAESYGDQVEQRPQIADLDT